MGRIRTLPAHVVNQIAAGEVVDRPASVVKELIENSLDAGATRIDVKLTDGGRSRIEIADDGSGMDADDLAKAFLPHATSKLSSVEDLEHIGSLGFRGEALASIGSVSRARIVSRPRGAATGSVVEDADGIVSEVKPSAAAPGTVIVVEGLFGSVPARRKFLRSAATELGHISDVVTRFALAHPDVVFTLEHAGRPIVETAASEGRRARLARFHGADVARALVEVRADDGAVSVEGFVSPPGVSRGDARLQQTFLNGRLLRDKTVNHALREAYRDLVPPGDRHPIAFLFLSCDPARVDVNVHPTKAEVRWRDSSSVHEAVRRAVRRVLEAARPGVDLSIGSSSVGPRGGVPASTVEAARFAFEGGIGRPAFDAGAWDGSRGIGSEGAAGAATAFPPEVADGPGIGAARSGADAHDHGGHDHGGHDHGAHGSTTREHLRPLGQALGTYLLFESDDGIVLVDQHALHERVLFDRISARLNAKGRLEVQHLLVPTVVSVSASDAARVDEEKNLFESLGWVVEAFGEGAVAVRAVPAVLRRPDPEAMLREVLALLDAGRRDGIDRAGLVSSVVDRMACRAAVMAGDPLDPEEVMALLAQAETLNHAHSCPHGRPTRLLLKRRDLERHFHRIQ